MPGLFGWIDLDEDTPEVVADTSALLAEMADRMRHAGDEVVDTWSDPAGRLVIARIARPDSRAIGWPEAGGRDARAFMDGTLHGSPGHVTARVEEVARRGRSALASLRGHFTAARWEPEHRRLTLAVDRRASRPLVYTIARGRLYFAPEVKALLAAPGVDKTLDEGAIGIFLGAGYLLADQTLFASIRRLMGGEALVIEGGRARVETYFRYELCAQGDGTRPRELEEELGALVKGAVERNLDDPARTVVFLSGGVDSRVIASAAQEVARLRGDRVRTVTWAAPGARAGSDRDVARRIAGALGTRHAMVEREVEGWGARMLGVTYLLDGLTDLPAYHPHEHAVMRDLAESGARVVLRGDECFGWGPSVASLEEARLSLNLREAGPLRHLDRVVHHRLRPGMAEASRAALDGALAPFAGAHPDDAKDQLYFRHRLQSYLGSAAYLKQVILDHRTPLVDEAVLDFNARVPAPLRAHKLLFCRAAARIAPDLFTIPLARRGNLEDWDQLLASRSPVRHAVEAAFHDDDSGIWTLFDRSAAQALLPPIGHAPGRSVRARLVRAAKSAARTVLWAAPPIERLLTTRSHRAGLRVDQILLRIMVLKAWHDLFVTGDGSRRTLAFTMGRAA